MQLTDNTNYIKQAIAEQELKKMQAQGAPVNYQGQDVGGVAAQMQNTGAQQATQNAEMNKSAQLMNAAGQPSGVGTGMANLGLAMALRKDKKKEEELANREASQWNQRPAMEYYSKGLNPMDIVSDQ